MSRYLMMFSCSFAFLLVVVYAASPEVKSRVKRALIQNPPLPKKPSMDALVTELAKKHLLKMILDKQNDLEKAKQSVYLLERDGCAHIKSIADPVTHNTRQLTQGAWMKDPLGIMGVDTIFTMEGYSGRNVLEEFENMNMFKAGLARKTFTLPYQWDGTGGAVYGPYLYYNRVNSPYIIKYNLKTEKQEAQITITGFTPRKNHYQWNGYSAVDLAVDEQGLWVLWGDADNSYRLYASKIDVYKNVIIQTWALATERMNQMGNAFVACGVIYCIDSYNSKSTTINFAYDTKTGKQWNPNIQFTNQYGYNSMVDYNPREKVLYAWDNKRLVTYPITFEELLV